MKAEVMLSSTGETRRLTFALFATVLCFMFASGCATPPSQGLFQAISQDDAPKVTAILKSGPPPKGLSGWLCMAASRGNIEIMRLLIDSGADVNGGETRGNASPMMRAAITGKIDAVRFLVEKGADINKREDQLAVTDITHSSSNGKEQIVYTLETVKECGHSALSLAITFKRRTVVRYLLEQGADTHQVVVSQKPVIAVLKETLAPTATEAVLNSSDVTVNAGDIYVRSKDGKIITNSKVEREKRASIKELAEMSGDKEITELLASNSK